jgi:hypothetical protein
LKSQSASKPGTANAALADISFFLLNETTVAIPVSALAGVSSWVQMTLDAYRTQAFVSVYTEK